jgi:hypothetical protein
MTRTVNGERLLDDPAKEILRKQLWQTADYCGLQILTYAILSNHFHVLVRVPPASQIPDAELLRRYCAMYPKPTLYHAARLDVIEAQLKTGGPDADAWRKRQLALMGDISQFMKLVKQRFSIWFNRSHRRYGTLWSERFKSVLLEPKGRVLKTMAAYIDLNCVRAGLATDPKDYRFCGYAEAVAGNKPARAGLTHIIGEGKHWPAVQAAYRESLFGKGSTPEEHAAAISPEQFARAKPACRWQPYCDAGYATSPTARFWAGKPSSRNTSRATASTTQRLGMRTKRCNGLRLATCTGAPIASSTLVANGSPE